MTKTSESNEFDSQSQVPKFRAGLVAKIRDRLAAMNASRKCINYVDQAMEAPARNTKSTPRSMSGKFPSAKVGATIGFESRTLELPFIYEAENDPSVLIYLDQAPPLKLSYKVDGRTRSYLSTPDFVMVRSDKVVVVECKRLAEVQSRAIKAPELYVERDGRWVCPPAEADAARQGMSHEVWTEEQFHPAKVSNLLLLDDFYSGGVEIPGYDAAREAIRGILAVRSRETIEQLLRDLKVSVCIDHVYRAIALGDIVVDMEGSHVSDHRTCLVYRDQITLAAFAACRATRNDTFPRPLFVSVEPGVDVAWDGVRWSVLNVGASQITLSRDGRQQHLPMSIMEDLIRDGLIESAGPGEKDEREQEISNLILTASHNELEEANRRLGLISPYLFGASRAPVGRSLRRYLANFRAASDRYGNGYVGLIPKTASSGNRRGRMRDDILHVVREVVNQHYLNASNLHAKGVYGFLAKRCDDASLPTPSYAWFCKFLKKIPRHQATLARGGSKLAYQSEARVDGTEMAEATEPIRPWERVHIDHTQIDLETVSSDTADCLGRPWLTVMIDHATRRILGLHLSFEPPSYRSVMAVMRDCVSRFSRLPESLVVDGGKEFRSTWFETTCARYRITIIRRPAAKARYGSQIERFFGTLNTTLLYFLGGNTQNTKNVRQMTEEVSPSAHAIWTFPYLYQLIEKYMFEVYDQAEHRALCASPRAVYELMMQMAGRRPQRFVAYDEAFKLSTFPSTPKGTARVQEDGIKVNYLYYNAPELQAYLGKDVRIVYDPYNMSVSYAFLKRRWVKLKARNSAALRGKTEKEIQLITAEWRRRRSKVEKTRLTDTALISFILEVQQTETLLAERRQAAEERAARVARGEHVDEDAYEDQRGEPASAPNSPDAAAAPTPMSMSVRPQARANVAVDQPAVEIELCEEY